MPTIKPARGAILLLSSLILFACQAVPVPQSMPTTTPEFTSTTRAVNPSESRVPTHTLAPTSTVTPSTPTICSPLAGHPIEELESLIVNPYLPPPPGNDRPHQGIDLAILDPGTGSALTGESVRAILGGKVSAVIKDRFPYGNAILVETSLQFVDARLPGKWEEINPDPALTCPDYEVQQKHQQESIYILYAHLFEPPSLTVGTQLRCGEGIGQIGMSGNALNPHVHVEARLGPAGERFESMAHYDSSATPAEMSAYCRWRVSGIFQHFDPLNLLLGRPLSGSSQP